MQFTPKYTVSYNGVFHKAKEPFEIDDNDAEMMAAHGELEFVEINATNISTEETDVSARPPKKGGRPKKAVNE